MTIGLNMPPNPDEEPRQRRKDLREEIRGFRKNPVEKKEKQVPHPDEHNPIDRNSTKL